MEETKKKGFTLIELLATIAILAVVGSIGAVVVLNFIEKSKDEANALTEKSIKEAANIYSKEAEVNSWKSSSETDQNEYFCVTVQELVNKGILKNEQIKNSDYPLNRYVAVKRNKTTKAIEIEEIVDKNADDELRERCTGTPKVPEGYIPEIKAAVSYTDQIHITVDYSTANKVITNNSNKDTIVDKYFEYGETSSNLDKSTTISGTITNTNSYSKTDIISDLTNNIDYYIRVCIKTEEGYTACTETISGKTLDFVKPSITLSENKIIINYYTEKEKDNYKNINGDKNRYFYSSVNGTVDQYVSKCTETDGKLNCTNTNIKNIEAGNWYLYKITASTATLKEITITAIDGSGEIKARIADTTGNYAESSKDVKVNKITFVKGNANKINSGTNDIEKICVSLKQETCKLTSPTITANKGYEAIGWNNDSNAIVSNWDINTEKDVSESKTYYPVLIQSPIYVYYYTNGGKVTSSAGGYKWTTDSAGLVKRDNDSKFYKIASNTSPNELGLVNYNNSNYVNITRNGFIAKEGLEWNTKKDGSGTSFSQDTVYSYNDLIGYATLSGNDYILKLYVNWIDVAPPTCKINVSGNIRLTISANDNSGKLATNPYSWTSSTSGYGKTSYKNVSSKGAYTAYVKDAAGNVGSCSVEITNTYLDGYTKYEKTCIGKVTCRSDIDNSRASCSSGYSYNASSNICEKYYCSSGTYSSTYGKCNVGSATYKSCYQQEFQTKNKCNNNTSGYCKWISDNIGCMPKNYNKFSWYVCSSGTLNSRDNNCYISQTRTTYYPSCAVGSKSGSYCYEYNQDYCSNRSPYYWTQSADTSYFSSESSGYYASSCSNNSFTCVNSKEGQVSVRCEENYSCSYGYTKLNNSYCYRQY